MTVLLVLTNCSAVLTKGVSYYTIPLTQFCPPTPFDAALVHLPDYFSIHTEPSFDSAPFLRDIVKTSIWRDLVILELVNT